MSAPAPRAAVPSRIQHPPGFLFAEDDYMPLERLSVALTKGSTQDEGSFTLCFWMYLLRTSTAGVVIRQVRMAFGIAAN